MKKWIFTTFAVALSASAMATQLSQNLPKEVGFYARIPAMLSWASEGQSGRGMEKAMTHPAHVNAMKQLRDAFNALDDAPKEYETIIKFLTAEQLAPLEIAAISEGGVLSPGSAVLLQTTVRTRTIEHWQKLLNTYGLAATPMTLDAKTGRLNMLLGMGASSDRLTRTKTLFAGAKSSNAGFKTAEARIDDTGTGLFVWADMQAMKPLVAMASLANQDNTEVFLALQSLDAIAFGAGSVEGMKKRGGRLALDVYLDPATAAKAASFVKSEGRKYNYNVSGSPHWVFNAALPTHPDEVKAIADVISARQQLQKIDGDGETPAQPSFNEFLDQQHDKVSLRQALSSIGPEFGWFSDEAGDFMAARLRDGKHFRAAIGALAKHGRYDVQDQIHHLRFEMSSLVADANASFESRLNVVSLYWREENGWLVFAAVPQALRDRKAMGARVQADTWLHDRAAVQSQDQVLAFYGKSAHSARQFWYAYLGTLDTLAHLAKLDLNLHALPSAHELKLPRESIGGLSLDYAGNRLGLSLNYDNSLADNLTSGGSATTVAVVAIVAAIALPAYQDYRVRAEVAKAYALSAAARIELSEAVLSSGKLPKAKIYEGDEHINIVWDGRLLKIMFAETHELSQLRGKTLAIATEANEDGVSFFCAERSELARAETTINSNHLTTDCRAN